VEDIVSQSLRRKVSARLALAGAILVGLGEAAVGFLLSAPGGSVLTPSLAVLGLALLALGGGWWWLSGDEARQIRIRYAATIVLCALFATVWTFDFALPAAMAADTQATHQALAAISARSTKDCMKAVITSGSIGPLHAPYERCVLSSAAGPTVLYLTQSAASGVAFDPGVETLLGATCVRHLTGRWWQWTTFTGTCPFGYQLASPS
jgi:hypothetical protein